MGGMRLDDVMEEIATQLTVISGLQVFPYPPPEVSAPAGYIEYPRLITYDATKGRGSDTFEDATIVLLAGDLTAESSWRTVARWLSGGGPQSVKALMEAHRWTTCDDLRIATGELQVELIAGAPYLAAVFKATIDGQGED